MSRCVCCNKLLNDRELHWKDSHGNFRDTCQTCLDWVFNPDQGPDGMVVTNDGEPVDEQNVLADDECIVYDVYGDLDFEEPQGSASR